MSKLSCFQAGLSVWAWDEMHIAVGVNDSASSEIKSGVDLKSISHRHRKGFRRSRRRAIPLESALEEREQEVDVGPFLEGLFLEPRWLKCAAAAGLKLFPSCSCCGMKNDCCDFFFIHFLQTAPRQSVCAASIPQSTTREHCSVLVPPCTLLKTWPKWLCSVWIYKMFAVIFSDL